MYKIPVTRAEANTRFFLQTLGGTVVIMQLVLPLRRNDRRFMATMLMPTPTPVATATSEQTCTSADSPAERVKRLGRTDSEVAKKLGWSTCRVRT